MVDAALAGLDQGEIVTIPALPDKAEWDRFKAARRAMAGRLSNALRAAKVHLVASSDAPTRLGINVDGRDQPPTTIHSGRLYTIFDGGVSTERDLRVSIPEPGLRAFTFTFG